MEASLKRRLLEYATLNRHRLVWKRRLLALLYGAGLRKLNQIKQEEK